MTRPKHFISVATIAAATVFAAWPSAAAEGILFTNAVVHTVSGPTHSPGFVLIAGDTIKAVGPAEEQPAAGEAKFVNPWVRGLKYEYSTITRFGNGAIAGFSVRCVKD